MTIAKRNRAKTMNAIVEALEQIVTQEGLQALGINKLSRRANVSKVLIYRYFGNLNGVLDSFLRRRSVTPQLTVHDRELLQPILPPDGSDRWTRYSLLLIRKLRAHRVYRELVLESLQGGTKAKTIGNAFDTELTALVHQLSGTQTDDQQAIAAVVLGGLLYLSTQADLNRSVLGIDLRSEAGWQRIELAIGLLYKAAATVASNNSSV